jgi:hypothetical protein
MESKNWLGLTMVDSVTGFVGIATAVAQYIDGSVQLELQPKVEGDNKLLESRWFSAQRCEVVSGHERVVVG